MIFDRRTKEKKCTKNWGKIIDNEFKGKKTLNINFSLSLIFKEEEKSWKFLQIIFLTHVKFIKNFNFKKESKTLLVKFYFSLFQS